MTRTKPQEIDLLFFREDVIGVDLPRQNPSDSALAQVMAWLCSPNPLQESQVWVALGRFNNIGKKKALPAFLLLFFPLPRLMLSPNPFQPSPRSFLLVVLCRNQSGSCSNSPAVLGVPVAHAELSRQGLATLGWCPTGTQQSSHWPVQPMAPSASPLHHRCKCISGCFGAV